MTFFEALADKLNTYPVDIKNNHNRIKAFITLQRRNAPSVVLIIALSPEAVGSNNNFLYSGLSFVSPSDFNWKCFVSLSDLSQDDWE